MAMYPKYLFFMPLLAVCLLSCKKQSQVVTIHHGAEGCSYVGVIPLYDTANIAGIFLTDEDIPTIQYFVWLFDSSGSPAGSDRTIICVNDDTLTYHGAGLNEYYPFYLLGDIQGVIDRNWKVNDSTSFVINYDDNQPPPYVHANLPDTSSLTPGFKIQIDSVLNADSLAIISESASAGASARTVGFYKAAKDSLSVYPPSGIYPWARIEIDAFTHSYVTIGGFKYLFIKEYVTSKLIYVK